MIKLTLNDALQAFVQAYLNSFNYGETRKDYYCGVTNDLERRAKEHNTEFIKTMKADKFENAQELEQALCDAGFDTGDKTGNGQEDSVYIYMYKKVSGKTIE